MTKDTRLIPFITGPNVVCTSATFSLQNPPLGSTTTWSSSNSNGLSINPSTGIATRQGSFVGLITITANVDSPGNCNAVPYTLNVWVGQPDYRLLNIANPLNSQTNILCPGSNNQMFAMYDGSLDGGPADYDWDTSGWWHTAQSSSQYTLIVEVPSDFIEQYIGVSGENECGESDWFYKQFFPDPNPCSGTFTSFSYSFSPNPANDELTISKNDSGDPADMSGDSEIVIHNSLMEKVYYLVSSDDVIKIPVSDFPEGMYYLQVANKKGIIQERILISR